jgi:DNA-binding HxlR family transcriptional regulator
MGWDEIAESVCQISCALSEVGDRWTLLIMLELSMGSRRFDELQAQTGISSHLLSTRLKRMEEDGLIERRQYLERPPRYEYHATAKGKELDAVLLTLRAWGLRWGQSALGSDPSIAMVYKATGEVIDGHWQIPNTGRPFTFDDVEATMHDSYRHEREAKGAVFQQKVKRRKDAPAK